MFKNISLEGGSFIYYLHPLPYMAQVNIIETEKREAHARLLFWSLSKQGLQSKLIEGHGPLLATYADPSRAVILQRDVYVAINPAGSQQGALGLRRLTEEERDRLRDRDVEYFESKKLILGEDAVHALVVGTKNPGSQELFIETGKRLIKGATAIREQGLGAEVYLTVCEQEGNPAKKAQDLTATLWSARPEHPQATVEWNGQESVFKNSHPEIAIVRLFPNGRFEQNCEAIVQGILGKSEVTATKLRPTSTGVMEASRWYEYGKGEFNLEGEGWKIVTESIRKSRGLQYEDPVHHRTLEYKLV